MMTPARRKRVRAIDAAYLEYERGLRALTAKANALPKSERNAVYEPVCRALEARLAEINRTMPQG
jgi:hypothetical protein